MISSATNSSLVLAGPQCRAAMFIDWENVAKCGPKNLQDCIEQVRQVVTVSVTRAYADWTKSVAGAAFLSSVGAELTHLDGNCSGKNSADMQLTVDACELLLTTSHFDALVLISGDRDFRPLVSLARKRGLWVWGIGPAGSSSDLLRKCCDRFTELKQNKPIKAPSAAAKSKPAPAKPKPAPAPLRPSVELPPIDEAFCQKVAAAFGEATAGKEVTSEPVTLSRFFAGLRKTSPGFNAGDFCGRTKRTHIFAARRLEQAGLLRIVADDPMRPNVQPTQVLLARIQTNALPISTD